MEGSKNVAQTYEEALNRLSGDKRLPNHIPKPTGSKPEYADSFSRSGVTSTFFSEVNFFDLINTHPLILPESRAQIIYSLKYLTGVTLKTRQPDDDFMTHVKIVVTSKPSIGSLTLRDSKPMFPFLFAEGSYNSSSTSQSKRLSDSLTVKNENYSLVLPETFYTFKTSHEKDSLASTRLQKADLRAISAVTDKQIEEAWKKIVDELSGVDSDKKLDSRIIAYYHKMIASYLFSFVKLKIKTKGAVQESILNSLATTIDTMMFPPASLSKKLWPSAELIDVCDTYYRADSLSSSYIFLIAAFHNWCADNRFTEILSLDWKNSKGLLDSALILSLAFYAMQLFKFYTEFLHQTKLTSKEFFQRFFLGSFKKPVATIMSVNASCTLRYKIGSLKNAKEQKDHTPTWLNNNYVQHTYSGETVVTQPHSFKFGRFVDESNFGDLRGENHPHLMAFMGHVVKLMDQQSDILESIIMKKLNSSVGSAMYKCAVTYVAEYHSKMEVDTESPFEGIQPSSQAVRMANLFGAAQDRPDTLFDYPGRGRSRERGRNASRSPPRMKPRFHEDSEDEPRGRRSRSGSPESENAPTPHDSEAEEEEDEEEVSHPRSSSPKVADSQNGDTTTFEYQP